MDNKAHSQYVAAMSKQLNYLKINSFPGLSQEFENYSKGTKFINWDEKEESGSLETKIKNDELSIQIPFAGTNFSIQLYFNIFEPWVPPDMIFSDMKFMKHVIDKENLENLLPSLDSWSYLSEDIIAQLLLQLYELYKKYQLECLEAEEVLHFEYSSLLQSMNIGEEDIEISLSGGNSWMASLLVRLPLNLKDVPPALIDTNPGPPTCLLHVSIKKNSGLFTPQLFLSPQVENLIGGATTLGLPVVPPGTSLSEYVCSILALLEDRVKSTILSFETRKQLIAQLLCCMGTALLEYDAEKFTKISFLLVLQDFNFILSINFTDNFPKDCCSLTFTSVYHVTSQEPFQKTFNDVRVSLQDTPDEMVQTIKKAILERLPVFKKGSLDIK